MFKNLSVEHRHMAFKLTPNILYALIIIKNNSLVILLNNQSLKQL